MSNISNKVYILSREDLFEMMGLAYRDAQNKNSLDIIGIINEVLEK